MKNPFQYYYALYEKPAGGQQTAVGGEGGAVSQGEKRPRAPGAIADERGDVKRRTG